MNCPNCGAPVSGDVCEYCGTIFAEHNKKLKALEEALARVKIELSQAEQIDYMNLVMGKWTASR